MCLLIERRLRSALLLDMVIRAQVLSAADCQNCEDAGKHRHLLESGISEAEN
jgi:hypothetical protein